MFLVNNLLFVLFTFTVLLGTVFPLVVEAVRGKQMSVGRPYFDRMVGAGRRGAALPPRRRAGAAVGPRHRASRCGARSCRRSSPPPRWPAIGFALGVRNAWTLLTLFFGGFTAWVTFARDALAGAPAHRARRGLRSRRSAGAGAAGAADSARYVVHAGAVIVIVAIAVSSTGGVSKEVQLHQGQSMSIGAYTLLFVGADTVAEPNRQSMRARLDVQRNGREIGPLYPRMTYYDSQREPIGSPAVHTSLGEDLYLSIHNIDVQANSVGLLVLVNPMVGWIWIATAVMALGGLMALFPARRAQASARAAVAVPAAAAAEGTP